MSRKMLCVNCGKHARVAHKPLCQHCIDAFPGSPELLQQMIETLLQLEKMLQVAGLPSVAR